jgi:hypothetical protein
MRRIEGQYRRLLLCQLLALSLVFLPTVKQLARTSYNSRLGHHQKVSLTCKAHYPPYRGLAETRRLLRGNRGDNPSFPDAKPPFQMSSSGLSQDNSSTGGICLPPLADARFCQSLQAQLIRIQI